MAHEILWKSLVALFVAVLSLCRPTLQEVTCSHGLTPTQLASNEDLDLRLGETLYLLCEEDSSLPDSYPILTIQRPRYDGLNCVFNSKLSSTTPSTRLRYVWHCEVHSSNSIEVHGFHSADENPDMLFRLNIRVHDLRSNVSATDVTQTTRPSEGATQATTTTTTGNSNAEDANEQVNGLRDDVTTRAPETSVPENAEKTLGLQIAVVILAAMVLLLVLLVIVLIVKLRQTRGEKSGQQGIEEGIKRQTSITTCSEESKDIEDGDVTCTSVNNGTIIYERPETAVANINTTDSERTTTSAADSSSSETAQERTEERVTELDSSSDSTSVLDTSTEPMLKQTPQS